MAFKDRRVICRCDFARHFTSVAFERTMSSVSGLEGVTALCAVYRQHTVTAPVQLAVHEHIDPAQ